MGLLGAHVADTICTWAKTEPMQRKVTLGQSLLWLTITMLLGVSQYVDTAAHFGGALTGFLFGLAIFASEFESPRSTKITRLVGITATVSYFALGFALFYTIVKITGWPPGAPVAAAPVA